ncbi:MAG: flagellar hook-basal body complex protein FliE [Clostridiales bacterium]|jgi:flagellar hook-basal body complex protein FliE|nr:flagellar hook-basal body complex protein FliE [Clostridiales bacterium]
MDPANFSVSYLSGSAGPAPALPSVTNITYRRLGDLTPAEEPRAAEDVFETFLKSAMDTINETNTQQLKVDKLYTDLATGRTDDLLAVSLAEEKAAASLSFTVQVTNKIIDAYKEIMRTQL